MSAWADRGLSVADRWIKAWVYATQNRYKSEPMYQVVRTMLAALIGQNPEGMSAADLGAAIRAAEARSLQAAADRLRAAVARHRQGAAAGIQALLDANRINLQDTTHSWDPFDGLLKELGSGLAEFETAVAPAGDRGGRGVPGHAEKVTRLLSGGWGVGLHPT